MLIADLQSRGIRGGELGLVDMERGDLIKLMLETYVVEFPQPGAVAKTWSPIGDSSFNEADG